MMIYPPPPIFIQLLQKKIEAVIKKQYTTLVNTHTNKPEMGQQISDPSFFGAVIPPPNMNGTYTSMQLDRFAVGFTKRKQQNQPDVSMQDVDVPEENDE